MSAAESVISLIQHYQKSIQKYHGNSARIQHCINKLYHLPVTVQHLQDTGVGKTINSLRKSDGEVGEAARALVAKWKQMVEDESENEQESHVSKEDSHRRHHKSSEATTHLREKFDRQDKTNSEGRKINDQKELSRFDNVESLKRKKEPDNRQFSKKMRRSEDIDGMSTHYTNAESVSPTLNGNNDVQCSYDGWGSERHENSGMASDDDHDINRSHAKSNSSPNQEQSLKYSDDESNTSSKETWHRKTEVNNHQEDKASKKEKQSSHKHRSKSSSSNSEKRKHSPSKSESRESKTSSSSKHKEEKSSSSRSSSSTKNGKSSSEGNEDKLKSKDKDKKSKHKDKHRSRDEKKSKEKKKEKGKREDDPDEGGVDSFSGIGFGEALGMMFAPDKLKKKSIVSPSSSPSTSKSVKSSSSSSEKKNRTKELVNPSSEWERECMSKPLEPTLEVDEDFGLPTLNPNYKPLPQPNFYNSPTKRSQNEEDDLSNIMYSKVQRTKVFSGNKTGYTSVPSLFDLCTRVLQENIDALEFTGGVPFEILKPVLERATPDQLFTLEDYNAYLIEDTDVLWEFHCKKDFRNKKREEMETWREMYMRCLEERENKLRSLTANIAAANKAKLLPVRKTQLAYIEGTVKPPRNIARKQAKFGTAHSSTSSVPQRQESSGSSGLSTSFTGRQTSSSPLSPAVSVPTPRGAGGSSQSSSCKPKPKAPLMQKALQLIKSNRFRR